MIKVENRWSEKALHTVAGDLGGVSPECCGRAARGFLGGVTRGVSEAEGGEKGIPSRENNCTKAPRREGLVSC